jgi:thiol-disulfide isomerase/thioredoxin
MKTRSLGSNESIESLRDIKPFLLYFSTPNCGVCHAMLPKLNEALKDEDIEMIEIDVSLHPDIAGQHRVFVSPTILVMSEGKEHLRESRFIDIERISRLLDLMK